MAKTEKRILAWHFLRESKRLRYHDSRLVKTGSIYTTPAMTRPLVMCEYGMHASCNIMDAFDYAPGAIICRVELWGEVSKGRDKLVARNRKVLWILDATSTLHRFAFRCVENAMALLAKPDPSWVEAIRVKRAWLRGKASNRELAAARDKVVSTANAPVKWLADAVSPDPMDAAWGAMAAEEVEAGEDAKDATRRKQSRRLVAMVMAEHRKLKR